MRAEQSYRDWNDLADVLRPLVKTRPQHAAALFEVLREHGVSILRFAEMIGVNERQARKYLEAAAPIPTTILDALPRSMTRSFEARLRALREPTSAADELRAAIARAHREGITDDVALEAFAALGTIRRTR